MMTRLRAAAAAAFVSLAVPLAAQYRPIVESIDPGFGPPSGGTVVTIRGKYLFPNSPPATAMKPLCTPCPSMPPVVLIGGKPATVVSYTDNEVVVRTPPSAGGSYDVMISSAYGVASLDEKSVVLPRAFQYGLAPFWAYFGLDRVLVPVIADRVPGAFDSLWSTELVGRNDNVFGAIITQGASNYVPPKSTIRLDNLYHEGGGAFLYLDHVTQAFPYIPIALSLRIRDLSRQSASWGTEVPLVRLEDAFIQRPMNLLNVPFEPESRLMLRLYDLDGPTGGDVPVQVFDQESDAFLGSTVLHLPAGEYSNLPMVPGFASLDVKSIVGNPAGARRLRVVVGDQSQGKRLWSILSVTDLETQQVTLITPKR